jgi:hypothetical protein
MSDNHGRDRAEGFGGPISLPWRVMRNKQATLFALVTFIAPAVALASEEVDICAQYSDTGKSYHVTATSTTGSELNQATHSLNYTSFSRYIVIFWAQNQASVIDMGVTFSPTYIGTGGTDQEGRFWVISAFSPIVCGP